MLLPRLATAAVGLPIVVALILLGGAPYAIVLALIIFGAVVELASAAGLRSRLPEVLLSAALAAGLAPAAYANRDVTGALLAGAVAVPLLSAVWRADVTPSDRPPVWLVLPAAALYAGWLGHYLMPVRRLPQGDRWTLLLILGTFATDSGAYAVGRLLGRHKLAPRVSPGKTIEGAIGGLAAAIGAVVGLDYLLQLPHRPLLIVALGAALSVAAQAGDLAESAVKRRLGVKDMGRLFPGHGGIMDRFDSLLFTGPVLYFLVTWTILR
ncbi:MAG TPA: phosphatidate cytidylyltransferase [Dehalococcoidia bacterium]|nr:phosphatidate cytidylyltransferase [Dehalococcoidia bacterium]